MISIHTPERPEHFLEKRAGFVILIKEQTKCISGGAVNPPAGSGQSPMGDLWGEPPASPYPQKKFFLV